MDPDSAPERCWSVASSHSHPTPFSCVGGVSVFLPVVQSVEVVGALTGLVKPSSEWRVTLQCTTHHQYPTHQFPLCFQCCRFTSPLHRVSLIVPANSSGSLECGGSVFGALTQDTTSHLGYQTGEHAYTLTVPESGGEFRSTLVTFSTCNSTLDVAIRIFDAHVTDQVNLCLFPRAHPFSSRRSLIIWKCENFADSLLPPMRGGRVWIAGSVFDCSSRRYIRCGS